VTINNLQYNSLDVSVLDNTAAYLAHEIRNPLSAAFLYCSILLDLACKEADNTRFDLHSLREVVTALDSALGDINHVVQDVLQLYRPQHLLNDIVNLDSLLQSLRLEFDVMFPSIKLTTNIECSPFVRGSEKGLRQVFRNLLLNSMQSLQETENPGHVLIRIYQCNEEYLKCEVCDNGPGIDPDRLPSIFEPFVSSKTEGSGLGLAVVAQVLRQHGAVFGFGNAFEGAMFWFEMQRVRRAE
jgi:signal transduction histidine kinase